MARKKTTDETKAKTKAEVKTEVKKFYKINWPSGWLTVKNNQGEPIGTIKDDTEIIGEEVDNRVKFSFDGNDGYVLKSCVK